MEIFKLIYFYFNIYFFMGCGNSKENSEINPIQTINQNGIEEILCISKSEIIKILKNNNIAYITNNKIIISPLTNIKNNPDKQIMIEIENFEIKNFIEFSKDKIITYGDKGFYIINLLFPNSFEIIDDFDENEVGKISFILELNVDCFITVTENFAKIWIKHNDTYISYKEIEHPEKIENILHIEDLIITNTKNGIYKWDLKQLNLIDKIENIECNSLLFYLENNFIVVGRNEIVHLINFENMKIVKDIIIGKKGSIIKNILYKSNNIYLIDVENIGISEWKIKEDEWERLSIRKENNIKLIGKSFDDKILGYINENSMTRIIYIK